MGICGSDSVMGSTGGQNSWAFWMKREWEVNKEMEKYWNSGQQRQREVQGFKKIII